MSEQSLAPFLIEYMQLLLFAYPCRKCSGFGKFFDKTKCGACRIELGHYVGPHFGFSEPEHDHVKTDCDECDKLGYSGGTRNKFNQIRRILWEDFGIKVSDFGTVIE